MKLLYILLFLSTTCFGQVGIGTTTPKNQLDINGWMKLGDETLNGKNTEGSIRYNREYGCVQFHNGIQWDCIKKQPRVQYHLLKDGIDGSTGVGLIYGGGATINIDSNYNGGGYGDVYSFTVNNLIQGERVLFLIEAVIGNNLRKNRGPWIYSFPAGYKDPNFFNYYKIYGNGTLKRHEVPGTGAANTYTTFLWSEPSLATGNIEYKFEINCNLADLKITSIIY